MKNEKTRRLSAIMFTDIVGYTSMMQRDEDEAANIRTHHRNEFNQHHKIHNGEILQYFGDGTLSVFQSGVEAVECAIAIQKTLNQGEPIPLRIGIHTGDIVFDGTEIYGDGVNLASRIESMGIAGSILISAKLNDDLKNHHQISTKSLGFFELKNIVNPVEVYSVTNDGLNIPSKSELKGNQKLQTKSIAVLPFVNMSSNVENEYFSDGMTEEIINALSKIKKLKVTSRTSSFFFKNKNIPIPQIGRELNVSTILEGSIRLSGNKMRITAQLIDVNDDFHFWSETFDRSIENIFEVQDEISLLIADKLREHLGHFEIEDHLVDVPEVPVEAYKLYLKSRYLILLMGKSDINEGISILEQVITEYPDFALGYLGINLGYTLLGTMGLEPANQAFVKAKPYLDKAIELNPNLPECQLQLSYISFLQDWDLESTYKHLNKALEIRPVVEYYQSMASTLVAEGKFDAALNYIDTALQLDPLSGVNHHLKGFIFYGNEKYDKAIKWLEKSVSLKSNSIVSSLYFGQTLLLMGDFEKALNFFQHLPPDGMEDLIKLGGTTLTYAAMGDKVQAEVGIAKLEEALKTDMMGRAMNLLMLCQTMMGNYEAAIKLIEQGIEYRLPLMVYTFTEPILKPLQSYPRFKELSQQVLGVKTDFKYSKRKYKKALFTTEELVEYRNQLETLMVKEKPYLDPDLTLRGLADILAIPSNHLSQLLNEGFDKNFAEYINSYRVDTFKLKAADPTHQNKTILATAYDSGFNSKTVFNTFFKKITGKTPKEFWQNCNTN